MKKSINYNVILTTRGDDELPANLFTDSEEEQIVLLATTPLPRRIRIGKLYLHQYDMFPP